MEKSAVKILGQEPLRTYEYDNSLGEKIVGKSKTFVFSDGIDSFAADATDNLAEVLEKTPLADGTVVNLQLGLTAKRRKTEQGREYWTNQIVIKKMMAV